MSAHLSEDRLIDLAAGLVAGDERRELLAHVASCAACEARFRATCADAERARLPRDAARVRPRWAWAAAGLAAALLAVAVLVPLLRAPAATGPAAYWLPVEAEAIDLRAAPTDRDAALFAAAAAAYRAHDPERVVALLRGRAIPESQDPLKLLYASALVKTGAHEEARATLDELQIETLPQPFRDRAKWLMVAALRAGSHDAEADALVRDLAGRDGEFADAARRLLPKR